MTRLAGVVTPKRLRQSLTRFNMSNNKGNKRKPVANTKTTIELNGKLYDALTGKPVVELKPTIKTASPSTPKAATKPVNIPNKGGNVDGFFRSSAEIKSTAGRTARTNTPIRHHTPQHPKTLVRRAVHKPVPKAAPEAQISKAAPKAPQPSANLLARQKRAAAVAKSTSISRFSSRPAGSVINKKVVVLPVQPAPKKSLAISQQAKALGAIAAGDEQTQIFANQLKTANSHKATKLKKPKKFKHTTKVAVLSFAVLMLGSFAAYRSIPDASVKLASARAGFSAGLPGYVPAGFSLSDAIKASPGQVVLNFQSNSDSRNYKVNQRPSDWTSKSLLNNFVQPNHKDYQTVYNAGKTIYIYDGSNATWVSNGIWYTVEGNSSLTNDQLVNIVNSL